MADLDVNSLFEKGDVTVTPKEHAAIMSARIARENRKALFSDLQGMITYSFATLILTAAGALRIYIILVDTSTTPGDRVSFAKDTLKILVPSVVAFFFGRAIGAK